MTTRISSSWGWIAEDVRRFDVNSGAMYEVPLSCIEVIGLVDYSC